MIIDVTNPPTPNRMNSSSSVSLQGCVRWACTDGTGTTVVDVGGDNQSADGTLVNSPAWVTDASRGSCIEFNGTTQYVNIDSSASYVLGTLGSIMGWVYVTATGQQMFMSYGKAGNANVGLTLGIDSTGYVYFRYKVGGTNYKAQSTVTDSSILNTWTHVGGQWQNGGAIYCYVNGVLDGTNTRPSDWGSLDQGKIGDTAIDGSTSVPMTGKVQNFAVIGQNISGAYFLNATNNPWAMVSQKILTTTETLAVYDGK
jgi:hypothetical protein